MSEKQFKKDPIRRLLIKWQLQRTTVPKSKWKKVGEVGEESFDVLMEEEKRIERETEERGLKRDASRICEIIHSQDYLITYFWAWIRSNSKFEGHASIVFDGR